MKHVFVFSNHTPAGGGIGSFLAPETGLVIVGWETDLQRAIQRIWEVKPDVIIVAALEPDFDAEPVVAQVLAAYPAGRVVEVNRTQHILHIHEGEQAIVKEVGELISVIREISAADIQTAEKDEKRGKEDRAA